MREYLSVDPWKVIEEGFHPEHSRVSESVFSIANGHMGQRGTFEEYYGGDSLSGSYMAGIYYPDKTIVGWWKVGYPEFFAKVPASTRWNLVDVFIEGKRLDLDAYPPLSFRRVLDLKRGILSRTFTLRIDQSLSLEVKTTRLVSMARKEIGLLRYELTASRPVRIRITTGLDARVKNEDANYGEYFWRWEEGHDLEDGSLELISHTRKTEFTLCSACRSSCLADGAALQQDVITSDGRIDSVYETQPVSRIELTKVVSCSTSRDHDASELPSVNRALLDEAWVDGSEMLTEEHIQSWHSLWDHGDVMIEGDEKSQQGIRFAIFALLQTYRGTDPRLNIGPKGFTGEKYGGVTYWDTEAFCLPFFLSTSEDSIARNLLEYRYHQLSRALENGQKMGLAEGAALYPMVTIDGRECHNEWEITFEEIHRNGAIAYAIYDYVNVTGDREYLFTHGIDVLCGIARFWAARSSYSEAKEAYVILGVTGPNEYENNVNNNWYTNRMAIWTLWWFLESLKNLEREDLRRHQAITDRLGITREERERMAYIQKHIYLPYDATRKVFLQQDGFLDKELKRVEELTDEDRPLHKKWTWDRILRSCFIKQADVLQGLFLLDKEYDRKTIERNFDFYEPMTVHESSLSAAIHAILAVRIGRIEKAYELFLRTSRLDLDDYNDDTRDGCHITSMSGSWMAVVMGFGGLSYENSLLRLSPQIPRGWKAYSFKLLHQGSVLSTHVSEKQVVLKNEGPGSLSIELHATRITLEPGQSVSR